MVDYGRVRSTVKPEPIVIDEFSVWQHTDIQEISENVGEENEFMGYEFTMIQYSKDEFILPTGNGQCSVAAADHRYTDCFV